MHRIATYLLLTLAFGLAARAQTMSLTINGKTVIVPIIVQNGKTLIDAATLAKLFGGAYDPAAQKMTITATAPAPTGGGAADSGQPQLPGENGQLNVNYKMGKDNPMYFRLLSATFTTAPVVFGDNLFTCTAAEKILLLRFTIQNPNKTDLFVRGDQLTMMVVDAMNVNHDVHATWGDAEHHQVVDLNLKPGQKIEAYATVNVPAKGIVPKLIVQAGGNDLPVLRYDLHGKLTPLTPPFADPADQSGMTALEEVPAQLGAGYAYHKFNITVEKFETVAKAFGEYAPPEDGSFYVATLLIKNAAPTTSFLRGDQITPELTSTDGETLDYRSVMLFATTDRVIDQDMKIGQEMRVRILFDLPKGVTPQTMTIKEDTSHVYRYKVP